jgi:hypothetical protein
MWWLVLGYLILCQNSVPANLMTRPKKGAPEKSTFTFAFWRGIRVRMG